MNKLLQNNNSHNICFSLGHAHVCVRTRHLQALAGPLRQHLGKATSEDGETMGETKETMGDVAFHGFLAECWWLF